MNKLLDWLNDKWLEFQLWLDSFEPCHKEQMGYTCRHRTLSNGQKECGDE